MKKYITPNFKFIAIQSKDIIATSGGDSVSFYLDEDTDDVQ